MNVLSRQIPTRSNLSSLSDAELLRLTQEGTRSAYGELWSRHHDAVIAATRSFTGYEPEDLAQEAFTKVYASIMQGGALPTSFRAYVASASRRIAINRSAKERGVAFSSFEESLDLLVSHDDDPSEGVLDKITTARAFKALPARQRQVLWYRDVQDLPVKDVSLCLGMSENATSVLIKRAREAFKASWITTQLSSSVGTDPECVRVVQKLGRYSRGTLAPRDTLAVEEHISRCGACGASATEADSLRKKLGLVVFPMLLLGGAPTYLEWAQSHTAEGQKTREAQWNRLGPAASSGRSPVGMGGFSASRRTFSAAAIASRIAVGAVLTAGAALGLTSLFVDWAETLHTGDPDRAVSAAQVSEGSAALRSPKDRLASGAATEIGDGLGDERTIRQTAVGAVLVRSLPTLKSVGSAPDPKFVSRGTPVAPPQSPGLSAPGLPQVPDPGVPLPPVTYPDYRDISTVTSFGPFVMWISATPGAVVEILIREPRQPDYAVQLSANAEGEATYDFPVHRGRVVSVSLAQEYLTASGAVRSDPVNFADVPIPLA